VTGTTPEILHEIHLEGRSIAIYNRDTSHLLEEANRLMSAKTDFRHNGSARDIEAALRKHVEPVLPGDSALLDDIHEALSLFQTIAKSDSLRMLLVTVNTNMCRRFHTDMNVLRLLCTYYGEGTLWLPEEAVDRKALDSFKDNERIIRDHALIQRVGTGSIAILKGAIYPAGDTKACVHRSPTIEESGGRRLLLRMDTNETLFQG